MALTAFEAASDPSRWAVFADEVRRGFGASSVYFWAPSAPGPPDKVWWIESGADPAAKQEYTGQWGAQDPWALHAMGHRRSRAGRCFVGSQFLPWKELVRTDFYNEFGHRVGLKGVMSAMVEDGSRPGIAPLTKLALFREDGLPDFDAEQLRVFQALQPTLRRALHSYWAFQHLRLEGDAVEQTLDAMPTPVMVLRRDGTLHYANRAAKALEVRGVVQASAGRVTRIAQVGQARLQVALDLATIGLAQEVALWLPQPVGFSTAALHLTRLLPDSGISGHWPQAEVLAMVQLGNAALDKEARMQAVTARCRLTPAEVQVLKRLANGEAAETVAGANHVGVSTVRTHIRHLLEKTHCRRMVDLLRMLGE
jgi:DNA-binding CsgD family transcriptional regulator